MTVNSYRDLEVWQKSVDMVARIYEATKLFPREELYTLTSQIRRAAISIPSNIAEGRGKRSTRDFMRYISIACGSLAELETQLVIAGKLGYLPAHQLDPLFDELARIGRMLNGMLAGLEKRLSGSPNAGCRMPDALQTVQKVAS
ncbi:MAG: four helix bundle protein [Bdellovibrionales bacterium]